MATGRGGGEGARATETEIASLQGEMLLSLLTGRPLPGGIHPVRFPDRSFLERSTVVLVLDHHLARPVSFDAGPRTVRVVSQPRLAAAAREHGAPAYLAFQAPEQDGGVLSLTLQAKVLPPEPGQGTLGLSSLRARFRRVRGAWVVQGEPEFSAE